MDRLRLDYFLSKLDFHRSYDRTQPGAPELNHVPRLPRTARETMVSWRNHVSTARKCDHSLIASRSVEREDLRRRLLHRDIQWRAFTRRRLHRDRKLRSRIFHGTHEAHPLRRNSDHRHTFP